MPDVEDQKELCKHLSPWAYMFVMEQGGEMGGESQQ